MVKVHEVDSQSGAGAPATPNPYQTPITVNTVGTAHPLTDQFNRSMNLYEELQGRYVHFPDSGNY